MAELIGWLQDKLAANAPRGARPLRGPAEKWPPAVDNAPSIAMVILNTIKEARGNMKYLHRDYQYYKNSKDDIPCLGTTKSRGRLHTVPSAQGATDDRGVLPFLEHDVATAVAEAHSYLFQWTTALWGSPVVLVESQATAEPSPNSTQKLSHGTLLGPGESPQRSCRTRKLMPFQPTWTQRKRIARARAHTDAGDCMQL